MSILLTTSRQFYNSEFLVDFLAHFLSPWSPEQSFKPSLLSSGTTKNAGGITNFTTTNLFEERQPDAILLAKPNFVDKSNASAIVESLVTIDLGFDIVYLQNVQFKILMAALFLFAVFVLLFFYSLHISLPQEICDRQKIQIVEFMLRLSNEYFADIVEYIFDAQTRNNMLRFLSSLLFKYKSRQPKWCQIENVEIAGVKCRLFLPQGKFRKSNALLVHIHGGGWCFMKPDYYDMTWIPLIRKFGAPMISIDYQLSPEVQFKTAILECERVLHLIYDKQHVEYNVDRNKIVLIGDSAGGNLSTVISQRALRQGRHNLIKHQILIYPVTHMFNLLSPSYRQYYNRYKNSGLLNPRMMARWFLMYLGIQPTRQNQKALLKNQHISREIRESKEIMDLISYSHLPDELKASKLKDEMCSNSYYAPPNEELAETMSQYLLDPDLCPILGKDLEKLAPAMILTAGVDILRDEGIMYVRRLQSFNVSVEWKYYPTAFHGVIHMPFSEVRNQMIDDIYDYLRKHLSL